MNPNLQLLLELEGLVLLRGGLELAGPYIEEPGFEYLDEKIEKLRHRLPGRLLSLYDRLARQYPDVLTVITDGICQGCQCEVSARLAILAVRSSDILQCEHCGRLIIAKQNTPDYVS
jgi:predicted  nucleic acid-binding Zn-ribbon protein